MHPAALVSILQEKGVHRVRKVHREILGLLAQVDRQDLLVVLGILDQLEPSEIWGLPVLPDQLVEPEQ